MHQPDLLRNLVLARVARARWASGAVHGHDWLESFERAQAEHSDPLAAMILAL